VTVTTQQLRWIPTMMLVLGAVFAVGVDVQRAMPLRASLDSTLPMEMLSYRAEELKLTSEEQTIVGVGAYVLREYVPDTSTVPAFSIYVGYYDQQTQGRTIHSPKNCLPGAGWQTLASREVSLTTALGDVVPVNRYLLQNGGQQALVLYWYQGRGRVAANEYLVKWDLLRDAVLRRRTEEALVRIVVPIGSDEAEAFGLATRVAAQLIPAVRTALPA